MLRVLTVYGSLNSKLFCDIYIYIYTLHLAFARIILCILMRIRSEYGVGEETSGELFAHTGCAYISRLCLHIEHMCIGETHRCYRY